MTAFSIAMLVACPALAQDKLAETKRQLEETRAKAASLALKVKVSEQDMEAIRKRSRDVALAVQKNEAALSASEKKNNILARDVAKREEELAAKSAQTQRTLLAMLSIERLPTAAVFAQSQDANNMLRSASLLQAARRQLDADAAKLRMELAGLKRSKEQLSVSRRRALDEAASLSARRKLLDDDLAKRSAMDRQLRRDQRAIDARAAQLSRESKSLQELVSKVSTPTGGSFASRGSLNAPVAGNVIRRFGEHRGANETYRGMVFSSRSQAVVVAPADGEVAFTGPFMDYGPMVLLRHNGGFISLLAGLGQADVRVGQRVRGGEPVGRMGTGAAPQLYVELRERGKPIDPSGWFANVGKSLAAR